MPTVIYISLIIIGLLSIHSIYEYLRFERPLSPYDPGFKYVHINSDGTARELNDDEIEYLNTDWEQSDSGRPLNNDGWGTISGFIIRRRVPKKIKIKN